MENQQQKNQLSVVQQNQSLGQTYQGGNNLHEITNLPTTAFLKKTYELEKIKDKVENVKRDLGIILTRVHGELGFKHEIDAFIKQDLSKMILSHYNTLSFEEIYKAFELERFGLYEAKTDHFQLFDSNYVSEILKKYKKWVIEQKKALNISAPKTEIELDKNQIRNEFLKTIFNDIKESGFCDSAHLVYDDLINSGKINPTNDRKRELYNRELAIFIPAEKENLRLRNPLGFGLLIKKFQLEIDSKQPIIYVQNKCKSILACEYLSNYIDFETFKNEIQ